MHTRTVAASVLLVLAIALPAAARRGARAGYPVTTTVTWTDRHGTTGEVPFQGTVRGRKIRGILQPASGELRIEATMADGGAVSGTVMTAAGDIVGTFAGRLDDEGKLRGSYTVPGGDGGDVAAPANALTGRGRAPTRAAGEED